jgi:hypothetical protein
MQEKNIENIYFLSKEVSIKQIKMMAIIFICIISIAYCSMCSILMSSAPEIISISTRRFI